MKGTIQMGGLVVKSIHPVSVETEIGIPFFPAKVSAGFPSPADHYVEGKLDLNKFLIKHPAATYFVRVEGDSMVDAGIYPDDILIVDRSITPKPNDIVVVAVGPELTVKKLKKEKGRLYLWSENPKYTPIEINEETELMIWGVVTYNIHKPQ